MMTENSIFFFYILWTLFAQEHCRWLQYEEKNVISFRWSFQNSYINTREIAEESKNTTPGNDLFQL